MLRLRPVRFGAPLVRGKGLSHPALGEERPRSNLTSCLNSADTRHKSEGRFMPREIIPRSSVEFLKKEAKQWLKSLETGDTGAMARLKRALPTYDSKDAEPLTLRTVQHALAREHGLEGW